MHKTFVAILGAILVITICFAASVSAATTQDGFQTSKRIESNYFTISIASGVDLDELTMKVAVPSSIVAIIREPRAFANSYELSDQLDTLFLAVSEIMDVRLRKFHCELKVCKDAAGLSDVAYTLFGQEIQTGGFYVVALGTLYIDAENISIHILGHELSHAIQVHYFVVPPPETIQEVLAGYVEYQLRKYTDSLPQ